MKKIIAILLVLAGIGFVAYGGYEYLVIADKGQSSEEEEANEIVEYLNSKYSDNFEFVDKASQYCLEKTEEDFSYTELCNDENIKITIYEVKDKSDVTFYVKKVEFDETKVTLDEVSANSLSLGLYDNYISFAVAEKLEKELSDTYAALFNNNFEVEIIDGIGIDDNRRPNWYQNLGKEIQNEKDKDVSVEDYLSLFSYTDSSWISLRVNTEEVLTRENFQEIVSKFADESKLLPANVSELLAINSIAMNFSNGSSYLEYSSNGYVYLKSSATNENIYDKAIILDGEVSSDSITYEEFMNLDPSTFTF